MRVIDQAAADNAILATDSGTIATWAARHFDIRGDRQFLLSGNLASMAPLLPPRPRLPSDAQGAWRPDQASRDGTTMALMASPRRATPMASSTWFRPKRCVTRSANRRRSPWRCASWTTVR
jgi:hypothetical protein